MIIEGRLPTVPEYYMEYIDKSVDLTSQPKQCCPFHEEDTPSFSYNIRTGRWSCFGKCHAHGDVIDMHKCWFKFDSREAAQTDLCQKYRVPIKTFEQINLESKRSVILDENKIENEEYYTKACMLANTPERWMELDYEMSKYPFDKYNLMELVYRWTGKHSALED